MIKEGNTWVPEVIEEPSIFFGLKPWNAIGGFLGQKKILRKKTS
jgi:hypothetical protein